MVIDGCLWGCVTLILSIIAYIVPCITLYYSMDVMGTYGDLIKEEEVLRLFDLWPQQIARVQN